MTTTIVRMLRLGAGYSVWLGCGCRFRATLDEARRDQLWIGKAVTCAKHEEERP